MDVCLPKNVMDELGLKHNETELVLTLEDKKNYLVHYRNLQFYLNQGMKLNRVQRVLQFDQECWMEPYNRMNTEFQKQAKNNFEENFYNLMNNSVFGKTMENVQKQVHNTIVCGDESEKICKLIVSPLFAGCTLFFNHLVSFRMHKECVKLDKSFYAGMVILDISKILMYDF